MHASCISLLQLNNRNVFQCIRVLIIQLSINPTAIIKSLFNIYSSAACPYIVDNNNNGSSSYWSY